jgi:hypothetical protein
MLPMACVCGGLRLVWLVEHRKYYVSRSPSLVQVNGFHYIELDYNVT